MAEMNKPTKKKAAPSKKKPAKRVKAKKAEEAVVKDTIKETIMKKMQSSETEEASDDGKAPAFKSAEMKFKQPAYRFGRRKSANDEVSFFLRQLSILLSSGVPLSKCLKILVKRIRHHDLHGALTQIIEDVESGSQFWTALSKHPQFFNSMAVNIVRTGEESGSLVTVINYLANYRDRESDMLRSIQQSITYPLFLLILSIGVVLVLVTTVIPMFARQFAQASVVLPWPTRFLIGISDALTNFWLIVLVLILIGIWLYRKSQTQEGLLRLFDRTKISLPVFGKILRHIYTVQFASMMSILLNAGLPVPKTLELVRDTMTNIYFRDAFELIKRNIEKGKSLFESFDVHLIFPPLVHDMITVGEESGRLPTVLDQLAEIYKKEVDHDTAIIGTLIEPILIVGLGLIVGFIALAMFMPYFKMVTFIGA